MKISARIKHLATHRYLALVLRLYIAGMFIYAGMYKINYTAEFAETIATYRMVPYWIVNFMAVTLPWIELICGIMLVCGIRVRSCIVVTGILLVMFTVGICVNLLRGAPISCGCFQTLEENISWRTLVRDLLWVAMTVHVFFYDKVFRMERKLDRVMEEI